jgi:U4/U6 small nuclear ribonucleoprotein PRP4
VGKRPAQGAAISPDSSTLATAAWNGGVSLWNIEDMREVSTFAAHEERCTDVAWHPDALCPNDAGDVRPPESLSFATASADGVAKCWNMAGECLHTLKGHTDRLARLAFHPSGTLESYTGST